MTHDLEHDMDIKLLERVFQEATAEHGTDFFKVNGFVNDYIRALNKADRSRLLFKLERIVQYECNTIAHKFAH